MTPHHRDRDAERLAEQEARRLEEERLQLEREQAKHRAKHEERNERA